MWVQSESVHKDKTVYIQNYLENLLLLEIGIVSLKITRQERTETDGGKSNFILQSCTHTAYI